ncbi:MAG: hypothetical protein CSA75_04300 [Sorangium cellulosum]|nr:MAG: hypothetical protein CSA75_04300 [Sorangium cellulosum]
MFDNYHGATGELSCNMVIPHQPRDSYFLHLDEDANGRVPGLRSYPVLSLDTGILPTDQTDEGLQYPKLLAPADFTSPLLVGGRQVEEVIVDPRLAEDNSVAFDNREPRVHIEQDWVVTYEGSIPGFDGHLGRFDAATVDGFTPFYDSGAYFCDRGVHDLDAARQKALSLGIESDDAAARERWAWDHADALHITEGFLDEEDGYWESVASTCSWLQCRQTFGLVRNPKATRDFPIVKATQGTLLVAGVDEFARCCFPSMKSFTVRPQQQWVVTGSNQGFLHHVEPDPITGQCVESCDPNKALLNARVLERTEIESVPTWDSPGVFRNPSLQFVVWSGQAQSERDMSFAFYENDGFVPVFINLASSTAYVQPQSLTVAPTGELVLADGSSQGLIFVDIGDLRISRSFY